MNTKTENKEAVKAIETYIKGLIESKKDGEITLDEISKQAKDLSRHDLIEVLRDFGHGTAIISGRKGAKSRLAYGKNAVSFLENRNTNQKSSRKSRSTNAPSLGNYSLRLSLNGKVIGSLPVQAELVAQAA